ncbi:ABC transporter permease [Fictibacillus sp. Mic-4]|uniref:ABC transporter permease n=1 Tax=Fictibacillus TaxID=1329200 RepID=UPI0004095F98|nr:ABC transporter permease [Fictibacillus gelatini]
MMDLTKLWTERRNDYFTVAIRYFRLIANSGFMLSVYILFVAGSYYYARILRQLPDQFPALWLFVIVFAYMLTRSPVRTLLKRGDLVFLLPVESQMRTYFKHAFMYSYWMQAFFVTLVFLALGPLFSRFISNDFFSMLVTLILLLVAKAWNLVCSWEEQRLPFRATRRSYAGIRLAVNLVFLFLLFDMAPYIFLAALLAIMYVLKNFVFGFIKKEHAYKWEHLLEKENEMMMRLYRIANLFTDVPQLSHRVNPRRYLSWIANVPYGQQHVYSTIYRKTFIRSNDYLGIFIRLIFVGWLFLYMIPNGWWHIAIILLFLHATGVQLLSLYPHHKGNVLFELYPVKEEWKFSAFRKWMQLLLSIQALLYIVFVLVKSGNWMIALLSAAASVLFVWIFTTNYMKKQLARVF